MLFLLLIPTWTKQNKNEYNVRIIKYYLFFSPITWPSSSQLDIFSYLEFKLWGRRRWRRRRRQKRWWQTWPERWCRFRLHKHRGECTHAQYHKLLSKHLIIRRKDTSPLSSGNRIQIKFREDTEAYSGIGRRDYCGFTILLNEMQRGGGATDEVQWGKLPRATLFPHNNYSLVVVFKHTNTWGKRNMHGSLKKHCCMYEVLGLYDYSNRLIMQCRV